MCGIVGLFTKNVRLEPQLGALLSAMLVDMGERGSDSTGIAIYKDQVPQPAMKLTLYHPSNNYDWVRLGEIVTKNFGGKVNLSIRTNHAVITVMESLDVIKRWMHQQFPDVRLMSAGDTIEIYKETGTAADFVEHFNLHELHGTHALGHTRMATESAITTEHAHPFTTGLDLCLVHNGSLSNHNRLRQQLCRRGIEFETDNDSEVAAGYLTWQLSQGATLDQALESALKDIDGFYTFAIGTRDGFAVLRDPIACKPAVMAETDDWVAVASEYRTIAHLPNAENARIWEPAPATIYSWHRT
ncbi:glutamate synthase family protein [Beggiatoa alba B18LD]|uniref:Glutamate synthase family protein n=1 Tax=Beggiatoa alba B18LD TaxID=395493 RepID=I3CBV7_9GAMM|nr:glutamine amidotransferase family protein [Beggiatoa alba]EIJ41100.1 glutamate synthase family protein [Beggiatoa alba B18LD]